MNEIPSLSAADRQAFRKRMLEKIRNNSSDENMRRMADDVLTGKSTIRDAMKRPGVSEALSSRVDQFAAKYSALSEEEREQYAADGAGVINDMIQEPAEKPAWRRVQDFDDPEDDFSNRSWMVGD